VFSPVRRHQSHLIRASVLRSIRPTRATTSLAASVDHTEARNGRSNIACLLRGSQAK
jgi:hypothetical protein